MMDLSKQFQNYDNRNYAVTDLIEASKDLPVVEIEVKYIYARNEIGCDTTFTLAETVKRVNDADLSFPIIMSPDGFVLDGKHRLAKAISTGVDKIKCVRFCEMPNCGFC